MLGLDIKPIWGLGLEAQRVRRPKSTKHILLIDASFNEDYMRVIRRVSMPAPEKASEWTDQIIELRPRDFVVSVVRDDPEDPEPPPGGCAWVRPRPPPDDPGIQMYSNAK